MPSFRVTMTVGALCPGVAPASVLPAAAAAGRELTTVEAFDVAVVSGTARLTVRFTADDGELAQQIGGHVVVETSHLADIVTHSITERVGGRWYVVT